MNKKEKEQLEKIIASNPVDDKTDLIRELKHSSQLCEDIRLFSSLKETYFNEEESVEKKKRFEVACPFLYTNYTHLFDQLYTEALDIRILQSMIEILRKIEMNELDQHSGSFEVGKLLKEIYIDTVISTSVCKPKHSLSWIDYKKQLS